MNENIKWRILVQENNGINCYLPESYNAETADPYNSLKGHVTSVGFDTYSEAQDRAKYLKTQGDMLDRWFKYLNKDEA